MLYGSKQAENRLAQAERLRLFLDYDGTLADFAPTPDDILPDAEVIDIITQLQRHPDIRVAVVSGRRLDHIRALLPVSGILLAGTYGVEMLLPDGKQINRLDFESIRPALDDIKPAWYRLITDRQGFYLEDKGWSLALHARFAEDLEAEYVLDAAQKAATKAFDDTIFRVLGGHKFLEIGPKLAHKGLTIDYLLNEYAWERAMPVYVGDDDKDEEAFVVINRHHGVSILVSSHPRDTNAGLRLPSPDDVRQWLRTLII